jgi:hypothetical protein
LVAFDREQVIATGVDDFLAHVSLAEQGVSEDNPAFERQNAQQFQGSLVFVGLGIDPDLGQDGLVVMSVSGDQMLTGRFAVAAATQGFAIERKRLPIVGRDGGQPGSDPPGQGGLECHGVQPAEQVAEAGRRRRFAPEEAQGLGEWEAMVSAELGDGSRSAASPEHGEDRQGEKGPQGVPAAVPAPGIGNISENIQQGKHGHGGNLQHSRSGRLLYSFRPR